MTTMEKVADNSFLRGVARLVAVVVVPILIGAMIWFLYTSSTVGAALIKQQTDLSLAQRDIIYLQAAQQATATQVAANKDTADKAVAANREQDDKRKDEFDTKLSNQGAAIGALASSTDQLKRDVSNASSALATLLPQVTSVQQVQALQGQTLVEISKKLDNIVPASAVTLPGDGRPRK